MGDFTLDTSGEIVGEGGALIGRWGWPDLSPFAQGYVEALFADSVHLIQGDEYDGLYWVPRFSDLSPEALALILRDCAAAQIAHPLTADCDIAAHRRAGAQYWFERCVICEDRDGNPPLTPYLSDDGKVCLTEAFNA